MADLDRLQKFYIAYYGRPADVAGIDYWSAQMDGRLKGQDSALAAAFGSIDHAEFRTLYGNTPTVDSFVSAVYQNMFGRSPESAGMVFWNNLYRDYVRFGYTPDQIRAVMIVRIIDGAEGTDKTGLSNKAKVARAFTDELKLKSAEMSGVDLVAAKALVAGSATDVWLAETLPTVTTKVKNISVNDSLTEYFNTLAFSRLPIPGITGALASLAYSKNYLVEREDNTGVVEDVITITVTGDTFKGDFGAKLGTVTNVPSGLTASLVKTSATTALLSLTGKASANAATNTTNSLKVVFGDADFTLTKAASVNAAVKDNIVVGYADAFLSETAGVLTSLAGQITANIKIDLATDLAVSGSTAVRLVKGSMASVTKVDLSNAVPVGSTANASVTFVGDSAANHYTASYLGDSIIGAGGADTLVGGIGIDKFVFSAVAAENGVDRIQNFKVGTGGDVLNFSAFLTKTGTGKLAPKLATATDSSAWANGDVLVVQGTGLTTPAKVAALFDTDGSGTGTGVFATPTSNSKAVLITADLTGDTSIWYLVKAGNITSTVGAGNVIAAADVSLVGVLEGVNSFSLLPLVTANLL